MTFQTDSGVSRLSTVEYESYEINGEIKPYRFSASKNKIVGKLESYFKKEWIAIESAQICGTVIN